MSARLQHCRRVLPSTEKSRQCRYLDYNLKALTKLSDNWAVLVSDLKEIATSTEAQFKLSVREQAEKFEHRMTNRNVIMLLMFNKDLLKQMVSFCKELQKKPGEYSTVPLLVSILV